MKHSFAQTSNVRAFQQAVAVLERRGAPEASFALVTGEPGHGKSRIGQWWATQQRAAFIRLKTRSTPLWFFTELARKLGETAPAWRWRDLSAQVIELQARNPTPIVVDEVEHGLRDNAAVIEALRDVTDLTDTPVLLLGREHVPSALRAHKQIWTRISSHVVFGPLSLEDVSLCFETLSEVEAAPDVIVEIHAQSEGRVRLVLNAIKTVERIGLKAKRAVTAADIADLDLTLERAKNSRDAGGRTR